VAGGAQRAGRTSIDVVIPTFDGWRLLERCLTHLHAQTVPHTVVVVDNGSTDGTGKHVKERFPEATLLVLPTNLGFPAACNRGAASGNGDVIVLLNNDVEPQADFLEKLVYPLEEDPAVGSAAALLTIADGSAIDSVGVVVDPTLAGFPRLRGAPLCLADAIRPTLLGPSGGAGAYRRRAWEDVGGLDEGVVGYGEDVDLALRLRSAGWETRAAPTAVGVHLGSASFGRRSSSQRYHGGYARGYFLRRYGVLRTRAAVRTLATEAIAVVGDAAISRDLSALRGRADGWRSADGLEPRPMPPAHAIDRTISFAESLRLRRVVYAT
jgi:N-acetylglucosaminyl-diphospho-decaprenol L-rhamnosyltransferase